MGWISTTVIYPDTTVHYEIYKNPEDTPDSGTLIESGKKEFDTWGYKTIKLDKQYFLEKGDTYSVIIKQTLIDQDEDGNAITIYAYTFPFLINYNSASGLKASAVINPGESFYCINGEWYDFSSVADQIRELTYESVVNDGWGEYLVNGLDDIVVDNYPVPIQDLNMFLPPLLTSAGTAIKHIIYAQSAENGIVMLPVRWKYQTTAALLFPH